MFNFHNRQYIFRKSTGEIFKFFCDSGQNLCFSTLTRWGAWSSPVVLHKGTYQHFYADMDQDNVFHLLFQDNDGNIHYARLDGQSARTVPVLNSRTPAVYNKQLYLAPFKNNIYFFYVLAHNNSFMLAYQALSGHVMGTPKVVDYVSGSSIPCSILYDRAQNIYAFYQSYDGKYLQLGYKKFNTAQKHWSDFSPVTKFDGNCEYPHAIIDGNDIIHLCYQRRAPKLYEMVYQQKAPNRNLWSSEVVVHSSVHPFENASIVQAGNEIIIYWVRDDIIYFSAGMPGGESWSKPSRYTNQYGSQLQCLCFKDNLFAGAQPAAEKRESSRQAEISRFGERFEDEDGYPLSPEIYPGTLAAGLRLAFANIDSAGGVPILSNIKSPTAGNDIGNIVLDIFRQLQNSVDEVRKGWAETRKEISRISSTYIELTKEIAKYSMRLDTIEKQFEKLKKPVVRTVQEANAPAAPAALPASPPAPSTSPAQPANPEPDAATATQHTDPRPGAASSNPPANPLTGAESTTRDMSKDSIENEIGSIPDSEKMKEWEEWKGPREWQGIGE